MENVKLRIALEKAITRVLVEECGKLGYVPVTVWDGGCYEPQSKERAKEVVARVLTTDEVIDAVFAVDEATVHFAPADDIAEWGRRGVAVIGGNGRDFIGDWHCGDKVFSDAVGNACDRSDAVEEVTLGAA